MTQATTPPSSPPVATKPTARSQAARILGSRWWQQSMYLLLLVAGLLVLDAVCYSVALPVSITYRAGQGALHVGTQTIALGKFDHPQQLVLIPRNPVVHEYQIDGTDSANNFTLDTVYLEQIAGSPYYRFQSWMRDLDGTSVWRGVTVTQAGQLASSLPQPTNGGSLALPFTGDFTVSLELQRPETPASFSLVLQNGFVENVSLDRNDRQIRILKITGPGTENQHTTTYFFPRDPMAFAAMVVDFLTRVALWAVLLVILTFAAEVGMVAARGVWERYGEPGLVQLLGLDVSAGSAGAPGGDAPDGVLTPVSPDPRESGGALGPARQGTVSALPQARGTDTEPRPPRPARVASAPVAHPQRASLPPALTAAWERGRPLLLEAWARLMAAIHPVGVIALGVSFLFCCWIALAQYGALPHVYDASTYFFGAKIYALGHLSVPVPAAVRFFPGPYMVVHAGQWFTQYTPGTSAMLAIGMRLGVPWLIEPVMGTLALLGIGLIGARLFSQRVATIAVLLGVLSPFYSYLAASYASSVVALCFLVWGAWALVRFAQGGSGWNLPVAAAGVGMGVLTQGFSAIAFAVVALGGAVALTVPQWRVDWRVEGRRWLRPVLGFVGVALFLLVIYLAFNAHLTGSAFESPRTLFNTHDHWGFGSGVGVYGAHTLAAGFTTLDELLTALAIDLFGWPFYLTLAFVVVPFVLRRARAVDVFLLVGALVLSLIYVGYYYHGIFLGPSELLYTLPFVLLLTARGILLLGEATARVGERALAALRTRRGYEHSSALPRWAGMFGLGLMLTTLLMCSLFYFWPRQIALHTDFTGMAVGTRMDFDALEHPPSHNAIVVTNNYALYGYTLFALNDPLLHGDVLYAYAATKDEYGQLAHDFPKRTIYTVSVALDGHVTYHKVAEPGSK